MHKIYNKKLKKFRLNPRLILILSSINHLTANFGFVLRSKTITWRPFKFLKRPVGFQSVR